MTLRVCKHSNLLCSVIFVNFYNFFSTMTSLCCHLSVVSTGNCKLGHDCRRVCYCRVDGADTTQLDSFVASAVCIGHYRSSFNSSSLAIWSHRRPELWSSVLEASQLLVRHRGTVNRRNWRRRYWHEMRCLTTSEIRCWDATHFNVSSRHFCSRSTSFPSALEVFFFTITRYINLLFTMIVGQ